MLYIKAGEVKLPVVSTTGRDATVAVLGAGKFFGEGVLARQPLRAGSATAHTDVTLIAAEKRLERALLLLAGHGEETPQRVTPQISDQTLAEMVGMTRPRLNLLMNRFAQRWVISTARA